MPWSEIFRFFYLLGFVNSFFFGVLVFSKKERSLADKLLGTWLMVLAIQFLWPFIYLSNFDEYFYMAGFEVIVFCFHPIFLFNYIKALTQVNLSRKEIVVSFLPVIVIILSFTPFLCLGAETKRDFITQSGPIPLKIVPGFIIIIGSIVYYLISGFIALKKHKNKTLHLYSYRDNIDLLWLRRLIVSYTGITLLSLPVSALLYTYGYSFALSDYIFYSTLVVFVFFLGYWGYQQGSIFNLQQNEMPTSATILSTNAFPTEDFTPDSNKIMSVMQKQKPFLDASLSLHQLAGLSGFTPHHLSKVINKTFNKNFFEFVNNYRINEFKAMLNNPNYKSFTLLGIAFECGFNSKSAFNRIFKEQTGITPREYKKQLPRA